MWREEHQAKAVHHLPANMPKELISAIEVLWQTAMEQAENQLAAIKKDLNDQQETIRQEKIATDQVIADLKLVISDLKQQLEEKISQIQSLNTELAIVQERLAKHPRELAAIKGQHEDRLKLAFEEKNSVIEKSEALQTEITKLEHQLSEQSEIRWVKLIDQARAESTDLRKNYESIISKQNKQIKTQQNVMVDLKNTHISQQSAFEHAQTVTLDLKEQLNQLRSQYNDATATITVLKMKLEGSTKKKLAKKEKITA
jgi:chromosome segregation ATPase